MSEAFAFAIPRYRGFVSEAFATTTESHAHDCHIAERRGPSASVSGKPLLRHWHTVSPTVLAPAPRVFKHPMLSVSSKCFDFRGPRIQNSEPETSAAQLLILGARGPRPRVRNPRRQLLSLSSACLGLVGPPPRGSEPQTSAAQPEQRMSGARGAPPPGFGTPDISCSA